MSIRIDLPWPKPPLRANDRRSWPAQHKAFQQALTEARWAVRAAQVPPIIAANATLHYRPTTMRRQDSDGIAPSLKPVLDALVQEGVLPDDSWVCVPETAQRIHEPDGPAAVWLELTAITEYRTGVTA